jgi:hypothetical protein
MQTILKKLVRASKKTQRVFFTKIIALLMEAVSSSETSVNIYQTTRHNIPEDSHLHVHIVLFLCN